MPNSLIPAQNVTYAGLAACVTGLLVHFAASQGYNLPPDVQTAITGLVAVLVAHAVDLLTGQNGAQK